MTKWLDSERDGFVCGAPESAMPLSGRTWAWTVKDAAHAASFLGRDVLSLHQEWVRLGKPSVPCGAPRSAVELRRNAEWMEMSGT